MAHVITKRKNRRANKKALIDSQDRPFAKDFDMNKLFCGIFLEKEREVL